MGKTVSRHTRLMGITYNENEVSYSRKGMVSYPPQDLAVKRKCFLENWFTIGSNEGWEGNL
jgi:hypothetical protein